MSGVFACRLTGEGARVQSYTVEVPNNLPASSSCTNNGLPCRIRATPCQGRYGILADQSQAGYTCGAGQTRLGRSCPDLSSMSGGLAITGHFALTISITMNTPTGINIVGGGDSIFQDGSPAWQPPTRSWQHQYLLVGVVLTSHP